ncbi:MAG: hemolysin family protein, partial [Chloroflexota bacterium]|nr:hemolysin family protein [Chloroflexota bacterium]
MRYDFGERLRGVGWRPAGGRPGLTEETSISTTLALLAVVVLVLANGFFVATEFALVSVRRTRMQQLAAEGNRRAAGVLARLDHLDLYIASTQLGITISSLGLGWLGEPALAHLIEPAIDQLRFIPEESREAVKHTVAFAVAFSVITGLHIVIGELAPKSLALQRPDETSLFASGPIHVFTTVFRPVIALLNGVGNAMVRLVGVEPAVGHALVQSADELKLAVDASREAGLVEQSAHDLVDRAFLFTDLDARHAMVPRTEMLAVPVEASLDDVLEVAMRTGHLCLPVYEGDLDHVVGMVNVKRLLPLVMAERERRGGPRAPLDLRAVMTEPLAVPETASASDVLTQLRESHTQIAIVIDEYGGTARIVTLVDLVENLVGEIEDELEPVPTGPAVAADGSFVLDGLTTLVEAKEFFDLDLEDEELDVETVGGYVFSRLGRPAEIGDEVTAPDGHPVRVEELDGLRVAPVRVLPPRDTAR